jgi:hypothetical protein
VTSLARELGRTVDHPTVENVFIQHFADVFGRTAVEALTAPHAVQSA